MTPDPTLDNIKAAPQIPANCFRCAHCKPLLHTNFSFLFDESKATSKIFCGKQGRERVIHYSPVEDCPILEKEGETLRKGEKHLKRHTSALERLLISQTWSVATYTFLCGLTGRSWPGIARQASKMGLEPKVRRDRYDVSAPKQVKTKQESGAALSEKQREIIWKFYNSGKWPVAAGATRGPNYLKRVRLRNRIVKAVNAAPDAKREVTWRSCVNFVYNESPVHKRRLKQQRKIK